MNLLDQLRALDLRDPGRWPLAIRGFFVALIFAVCAGVAWYMLVWNEDRPLLQKAEADELDLRSQFENKQQRAANLDAYKAQLGEMERSFGAMLRQLPGKTEVPNLLVDISQTGLAAGLQEKLFQPGERKEQRLLRGAADQDQAGGQLSSIRRLRERHRRIAAHRHAARHSDHAGRCEGERRLRQFDHGCDRQDLSLYRGRRGRTRPGEEPGEEKDRRRDVKSIAAARAVCAAVLASCVAAGCSGGQSDLQKWIAETKKKPGGRIQALPEVKPYESFVYSASNLRSPFQPVGPTLAGRPACARARGATASFWKDSRSIR